MNKISVFAFAVLLTGLIGCVKPPTAEEWDNADFGPPPGKTYEEVLQVLREELFEVLFDSGSAILKFPSPPTKRWVQKPGGKRIYGWGGQVLINAKNRFGAYIGVKKYDFVLRYGKLVFFEESKFVNH